MKKNNLLIFVCVLLSWNSTSSLAQEEKKSIKLALNYTRINDQAPEVRAIVKSKNGKKFEPVDGVEVEFFFGEQAPANSLGKGKTNGKGIALIDLPSNVLTKIDSMPQFTLLAFVPESKEYNEQSAEAEITKARIDLSVFEVDGKKEVGAKLLALKEGKWSEVPETEIKLFVRRMSSDLSLSENALTTDAGGDVSAEYNFKTPLPGDANGNIIIGAKVEEHENFGTIETVKYAKWGAPKTDDRSFYERSLFASRDKTPIWLLIFPNLIITVVWGLIFYLVILIFKIRRAGLES